MNFQQFQAAVLAQYPRQQWQFKPLNFIEGNAYGAIAPNHGGQEDWDNVGYFPLEPSPWAVQIDFVSAEGRTLQEAESRRKAEQVQIDDMWEEINKACAVEAA